MFLYLYVHIYIFVICIIFIYIYILFIQMLSAMEQGETELLRAIETHDSSLAMHILSSHPVRPELSTKNFFFSFWFMRQKIQNCFGFRRSAKMQNVRCSCLCFFNCLWLLIFFIHYTSWFRNQSCSKERGKVKKNLLVIIKLPRSMEFFTQVKVLISSYLHSFATASKPSSRNRWTFREISCT